MDCNCVFSASPLLANASDLTSHSLCGYLADVRRPNSHPKSQQGGSNVWRRFALTVWGLPNRFPCFPMNIFPRGYRFRVSFLDHFWGEHLKKYIRWYGCSQNVVNGHSNTQIIQCIHARNIHVQKEPVTRNSINMPHPYFHSLPGA